MVLSVYVLEKIKRTQTNILKNCQSRKVFFKLIDRDRRIERPFEDTATLDGKHNHAVDQLCHEIQKVLLRSPGKWT